MILYGKQIFLYVLKYKADLIKRVYLAKECDKRLFARIKSLNVPIEKLDFKRAQALARGGNHQGFLAQIEPLEFSTLEDIKDKNFLLMLYGLSDVGNIGAICRSAYALGVDGLIVSGIKSLNLEGILRTSSGAVFELPIVLISDGLSAINELKQKNFYLYASVLDGNNIKNVNIKDKKVLILGSEGEGIPKKALSRCDEMVSINMVREFDSLNVSAAAAILCDRIVNG